MGDDLNGMSGKNGLGNAFVTASSALGTFDMGVLKVLLLRCMSRIAAREAELPSGKYLFITLGNEIGAGAVSGSEAWSKHERHGSSSCS